MVAIKDFDMPSYCMNCDMFQLTVLAGEVANRCIITGHIIDNSDEYLNKRADDCPLVELVDIPHNNVEILDVKKLNSLFPKNNRKEKTEWASKIN